MRSQSSAVEWRELLNLTGVTRTVRVLPSAAITSSTVILLSYSKFRVQSLHITFNMLHIIWVIHLSSVLTKVGWSIPFLPFSYCPFQRFVNFKFFKFSCFRSCSIWGTVHRCFSCWTWFYPIWRYWLVLSGRHTLFQILTSFQKFFMISVELTGDLYFLSPIEVFLFSSSIVSCWRRYIFIHRSSDFYSRRRLLLCLLRGAAGQIQPGFLEAQFQLRSACS